LLFTFTASLLGCPADDDADDGADTAGDDVVTDDAATDDAATDRAATDDAATGTDDAGTSTGDTTTGDADSGDSGTDTAACADESAGPPAEPLEIEGSWTDDFAMEHEITAESWTQSSEFGTFVYAIATFDNTADTLVAQDEGDSTWSKFQWAAGDGGTYWYCQVAFGEPCRADAEAVPAADPSDPATGGCGMFPWSLLTPGE
jgi:hypothetical protein